VRNISRAVAWNRSTRAVKRAVVRRAGSRPHGGKVPLGLVHGAGDAVRLKAVDAFHPLVAHRVRPEGHPVQEPAKHGKDQRRRHPLPRAEGRHAKTHRSQRAAHQLARDRRAPRHGARVIRLLGDQPLPGEPRGQHQHAEGREVERKPHRLAEEGHDDEGRGRKEEQVDPHPGPAPPHGRSDRGCPGAGQSGGIVRAGAELAAIAPCHQAPPRTET
jgi:hypothetical protein